MDDFFNSSLRNSNHPVFVDVMGNENNSKSPVIYKKTKKKEKTNSLGGGLCAAFLYTQSTKQFTLKLKIIITSSSHLAE